MNYLTINDIKTELTISKKRAGEFNRLERLHEPESQLGMYYKVLRHRQEKHTEYLTSELLTKEIFVEFKRLKLNKTH